MEENKINDINVDNSKYMDNNNNSSSFDDDDDDEVPILLNLEETEEEYVPPKSEDDNNNNHPQKIEGKVTISKTTVQTPLAVVPVTILTGFLGSGKTSLVQYILRSPDHGKKIAVIENEYSGASSSEFEKEGRGDGVLNIENIIARDGTNDENLTEFIELPNGCICCTVKDKLVETLELLLSNKKAQELDYILIECSGMANPGPIASIFWLDDALESRIRLDGIVTCVDARNLGMQLLETSVGGGDGGEEAAQQIAFADRIIINKTDQLLEERTTTATITTNDKIHQVMKQIRSINTTAPIRTTTFSQIPDISWILDTQCFDMEKIQEVENSFAHINNDNTVDVSNVNSECMTVACIECSKKIGIMNSPSSYKNDITKNESLILCGDCTTTPIATITPDQHIHTSSISTVVLIEYGSISLQKIHSWLAKLLWPNQDQPNKVLMNELDQLGKVETLQKIIDNQEGLGEVQQNQKQETKTSGGESVQNIFRIKGIISVQHNSNDNDDFSLDDEKYLDENGIDKRRYIVQAVNDLWDIHPASDSLSFDESKTSDSNDVNNRICKVVVIGRNLNETVLKNGFQSCFFCSTSE